MKISQFLNSVIAADVRRPSPSSLRYDDQLEVRLPLATHRVVLRYQLLVAGRCDADIDVGRPAAVGDGYVALKAVLSSLASKHRRG